jgi:hypothetical protein
MYQKMSFEFSKSTPSTVNHFILLSNLTKLNAHNNSDCPKNSLNLEEKVLDSEQIG